MEVLIEDLIKNAVHFGHKTARWNPRMKEYILGASKGIHIFDVHRIKEKLEEALDFVAKEAQEGRQFLLIGTKFQVSDLVASIGKELGISYINNKWLPGVLTNFETIKRRIHFLRDLDEMEATGEIEKYTKNEQSKMKKKKEDLLFSLGGVKDMDRLPDVVIVVDSYKEAIATKEARKLGIDIVALLDTNGDPEGITCPIPCNDNALKSLTYILTKLKEAYSKGRGLRKPVAPPLGKVTTPDATQTAQKQATVQS